MIANSQKVMLHVYARAAGISEPAYRNVLRQQAGCVSAADTDFTQSGWEQCMAALESILFARVDAGQVSDPMRRYSRWIRERTYWRDRLPKRGAATSRQLHRIRELWAVLQTCLPPDRRGLDYLSGIIRQSVNRNVDLTHLSYAEAAFVINALQDRVTHAVSDHARAEAGQGIDARRTA